MQGRIAQYEGWGRKDILVSARPIPAAARGRPALNGDAAAGGDCAGTAPVAGGPLTERMVAIAQAELKKGINDGGANNVPYNNNGGYAWCASFLTWVWRRAGVDIPELPCSSDVLAWAREHGTALPATATPAPGDAVLYGTGPGCPAPSVHVGMVEQVLPDGRITTIEGNLSDTIVRMGPFWPRDAEAAGEPGPIYAFARAYRGTAATSPVSTSTRVRAPRRPGAGRSTLRVRQRAGGGPARTATAAARRSSQTSSTRSREVS